MKNGWIFRVFVASPSDLVTERSIIRDVVETINRESVYADPPLLIQVVDSQSANPGLGAEAQSFITPLLQECDLLIAMFWSRLGKPTSDFKSGTIEEIQRFQDRKGGEHVLFFLSDKQHPTPPRKADANELKRLQGYVEAIAEQGYVNTYADDDSFKSQLLEKLRLKLRTISSEVGSNIPSARIDSLSKVLDRIDNRTSRIESLAVRIDERLRTSYVGEFPRCFDAILKCVDTATRSLKVLCDFPCYGYLSANEKYVQYETLIRRKKDFTQIVVPSRTKRKRLTQIQFGTDEADWARVQEESPEIISQLENEFPEYPQLKSMDDFNERILSLEKRTTNSRLRDLVRVIEEIPALYVWIADGERAVFEVPRFGKNASEHGFYTEEPGVVSVLESVWSYYHVESKNWDEDGVPRSN